MDERLKSEQPLPADDLAALERALARASPPPPPSEALKRAMLADFERVAATRAARGLAVAGARRGAPFGVGAMLAAMGFALGAATANADEPAEDAAYTALEEAIGAVFATAQEDDPWRED